MPNPMAPASKLPIAYRYPEPREYLKTVVPKPTEASPMHRMVVLSASEAMPPRTSVRADGVLEVARMWRKHCLTEFMPPDTTSHKVPYRVKCGSAAYCGPVLYYQGKPIAHFIDIAPRRRVVLVSATFPQGRGRSDFQGTALRGLDTAKWTAHVANNPDKEARILLYAASVNIGSLANVTTVASLADSTRAYINRALRHVEAMSPSGSAYHAAEAQQAFAQAYAVCEVLDAALDAREDGQFRMLAHCLEPLPNPDQIRNALDLGHLCGGSGLAHAGALGEMGDKILRAMAMIALEA